MPSLSGEPVLFGDGKFKGRGASKMLQVERVCSWSAGSTLSVVPPQVYSLSDREVEQDRRGIHEGDAKF